MVGKKNPKKVVTSCPLKKEKGLFVKSECPAIKNVRSVRNRLNAMIRAGESQEMIDKFRTALKKAKTEEAKKNQCDHCYHKDQN